MIDKADFKVRAGTPLTSELRKIIMFDADKVGRRSKAYEMSIDLRQYEIPAIVHLNCKLTPKPNHKIEIMETGSKNFAEIVDISKRVFQCTPELLPIVRADLTADVHDVDVPWFRDNTYVAFKRIRREIGEIDPVPYRAMRNGKAQTLYAGKLPNAYRIYDKVGERIHRYRAMMRSTARAEKKWEMMYQHERLAELIAPGIPRPRLESFETIFGHSPFITITRVERQCHGRDLEKLELKNMQSFRTAARYLRPFDNLRFFHEFEADLSVKKWGLRDHYIGMGIKNDIEKYGYDAAREIVKADQKSNALRWWKKYQPFISAAMSSKEDRFTSAKLQAEYERSTYLQMAA